MFLKYYQKLDDAISYLFSSVSDEKKLIKSIFKDKKISYVDIGTNEGNYLDYLNDFCQFRKIICFEPIEELSKKINIKYRNEKIKVYNIALSNKNVLKKFYQYKISSQSSFYKQNNLFKSLKSLKKIKKIKARSFDSIFIKKDKIDFCKIDVQGEEVNVLNGMKNNLKKNNIKLIKIEISFIQRYLGSKTNFFEIVKLLKKFNYELISISKIKYKNHKILLMDTFFEKK